MLRNIFQFILALVSVYIHHAFISAFVSLRLFFPMHVSYNAKAYTRIKSNYLNLTDSMLQSFYIKGTSDRRSLTIIVYTRCYIKDPKLVVVMMIMNGLNMNLHQFYYWRALLSLSSALHPHLLLVLVMIIMITIND